MSLLILITIKEREELEGIDSDKSSNTTLNSILPADNKDVAGIYQQQSQDREKNIENFLPKQIKMDMLEH